jgi:hypothetical protein
MPKPICAASRNASPPGREDYQQFLTIRLTAAPNVVHVTTALAIRAAKQEPGVPIAVNPPEAE